MGSLSSSNTGVFFNLFLQFDLTFFYQLCEEVGIACTPVAFCKVYLLFVVIVVMVVVMVVVVVVVVVVVSPLLFLISPSPSPSSSPSLFPSLFSGRC